MIYIKQLLEVYAEKMGMDLIARQELMSNSYLFDHLLKQRASFFYAEELRIYARENLPPDSRSFEDLTEEIYLFVDNIYHETHNLSLDRVNKTIDRAGELVTNNALSSQLKLQDKQGICHHLANENKLNWKDPYA